MGNAQPGRARQRGGVIPLSLPMALWLPFGARLQSEAFRAGEKSLLFKDDTGREVKPGMREASLPWRDVEGLVKELEA